MADMAMALEPIEAPEVEAVDTDTEVVDSSGGDQSTEQGQEQTEQQDPADQDPYSSKNSKEYSNWLKGLSNDPNNAKFVRMSKDNHARLFALNQVEPRGIDGVRETYATLSSIQHGELRGVEAVSALQDTVREVADLDELIVAGDVKALSSLGPEMQAGVLKMVPHLLEQQRSSDPEGYKNAVLPHFVQALRDSPLVGSFNALVDVLNEQPPAWLPADRKEAWTADRLNRVVQQASAMGEWLNAQDKQAKALQTVKPGATQQPTVDQERSKFEKEVQDHHWNTKIQPGLAKHASDQFNKLFQPYSKRLKLNPEATADLKREWSKSIAQKANANPVYQSQIKRFRATKNPDAASVLNVAKIEFDKHGQNVLKSLVDQRYGAFLKGQGTQQPAKPQTGAPVKPVAPNVKIVGVKPPMNQINHKATPLEWIHQGKYRLLDGSIVQVRR